MKSFLISGAAGRLLGVWNACSVAFSAYVGTELLGIAADETDRQRETIPRSSEGRLSGLRSTILALYY
jgi:L-asparagine transporter-like permease